MSLINPESGSEVEFLWPAAAAPVALAAAGVGTVVGQLPAVLAAAAVVWLYRRSGTTHHHRTA